MHRYRKRVGALLGPLRREDGQSIILVAVCLVVLLGVTGLVIDVGRVYQAQRQLQTATDAAALAAAESLPNGAAAEATACSYSAVSMATGTCENGAITPTANGKNYDGILNGVHESTTLKCISLGSAGVNCQTGTDCQAPDMPQGCNAVKVTETAAVPLTFLRVLGFTSQTVSATSTAGMAGGIPHPLDVEMVNDTTGSMNNHDTCGGTPTDVPTTVTLTQEDCAKAGIRALLTSLLPCDESLSSCGSVVSGTNNVSNPVDEVGMVTFPALQSYISRGNGLGIPDEINCTNDLNSSNGTYTTNSPDYDVVPLSSDFRYSDASTTDPLATLNPASNLVRSVYWAGDGCPNGGYPIPTGGPASSISGGGSGDFSNANNTGSAIGGGVGAANNSTSTVNAGIARGNSTSASNVSAIARGATMGTSNTKTIGGGPNSGDSNDISRTNSTNKTNISLMPPNNSVAGGFLLETITLEDTAITSTTSICEHSGTTGWTLVDQEISGTVLQATFKSVDDGSNTSRRFDFFNGANCTGGNLTANAESALMVHYTNVGSVDVSGGTTNPNFTGSAPSSTWAVANLGAGPINAPSGGWAGTDYASLGTPVCGGTSAITCNTASAAATGVMTAIGFTLTTATTNKTTYTVTLMVNGSASTLNCTVGTSSKTCTPGGSSVAVNSGDKLQLRVVEGGSAPTANTSTATTSATEQVNQYVSLSANCSSTAVAGCNTTLASAGSVSGATFTFGSAVPTGDTFTVTMVKNQVNTAATCTITAGNTSCTIGTATAVAANDKVELLVAQTGGTNVFATNPAATTSALEQTSVLTAPAVTTTTPDDQIVRLYGTGSATFASGTVPPSQDNSSSLSTGADDAEQDAAGTTGATTVSASTADNWVGQTVALSPTLPSSITVQPPAGYVAGDFMLVTIGVQNLGTGAICAPGAAGVWNTSSALTTTSGSGATKLTQQTFWTTNASPGYVFNFKATCPSGAAVNAGATAVAVDYTGVDTTTPLDGVTPSSVTGSSAALTAQPITPASLNDEVVSLFATNAPTLTLTASGGAVQTAGWTSTGVNDQAQPTATSVTPQGGSTAPTSANWSEQTVALRPALSSSITLTAPSDYSAATGGLLLVTISAQGLGGSLICAPSATPIWNPISTTTVGSGLTKVTQESFWTMSASPGYTFTFMTSCSGGTATPVGATAIATTFTGVDPTTPLDGVTPTSTTGTSATLSSQPITTSSAADDVVTLFSTDASTLTVTGGIATTSLWTSSGINDQTQPAPGIVTPAGASSAPTSAGWTEQTIALRPVLISSITVTPPSAYVAGGADLLVVSVAAQSLGNGRICSPTGSAAWTPIPVTTNPTVYSTSSGTLTQETFYSSTATATPAAFTFSSNSSCPGAATAVAASAVAINYTGVDVSSPLDGNLVATQGTSTQLTPGPITTTVAGDEVVSLYATNGVFSTAPTLATTTGITNSGANNLVKSPAGAVTSATLGQPSTAPPAANWTTETIALRPLGTAGIVVNRPPTPTANDFVMVTVTANGLTAAGNNICAPNDGSWTELGTLLTSGAISQATFYSSRSTATAESYAFTFRSGVCPSGGTELSATATAVAVRYTGVNAVEPIDTDGSNNQIYSSKTGTGNPVSQNSVSPAHTGDEIVALYGTGSTSFTGKSPTGGLPTGFDQSTTTTGTTGYYAVNLGSSSSSQTASPLLAATSKAWIGQTVALQAAYSGCTSSSCEYGMEVTASTDYGRGIKAAQDALTDPTVLATRTTAQKVIILLSDGDANTYDLPNPCQYGITQAENAETAGTWVFTIAYGSYYKSSDNGCKYDTSGPLAGLTPQCAMILMADNSVTNKYDAVTNPDGFANDTAAKAALCPANTYEPSDPGHRYYSEAVNSTLEDVFASIGDALTSPRLLSDNAS